MRITNSLGLIFKVAWLDYKTLFICISLFTQNATILNSELICILAYTLITEDETGE